MWAIAAIIGPALGGLFVSTNGWRWIFTINIPIGLVATTLFWSNTERAPERTRRIALDFRGTVLLTAAVPLLLIGLGTGKADATPSWPLFGLSLLLLPHLQFSSGAHGTMWYP